MELVRNYLKDPKIRYGVILVLSLIFIMVLYYESNKGAENSGIEVNKIESDGIKDNCVNDQSYTSSNDINLYVDLSGALVDPGVYMLKKGSIIADAISLAGGIKEEASGIWVSRYLDLSRKIDGNQKIYIPYTWEIEAYVDNSSFENYISSRIFNNPSLVADTSELSKKLTNSSGVNKDISSDRDDSVEEEGKVKNNGLSSKEGDSININTSTLEQLESLPGIGPAYAQRIVDNRPYEDFSDLKDRSKVPSSTLEKIEKDTTF